MTKLLVVDDSALMRRLLGDVFRAEDVEVAFARDGAEALQMAERFQPDVITLDINMPGMDGLETLDRLMLARPCPVVMVSSLTAEGAEATLDALSLGAVDFIEKPQGAISLRMQSFAPALVAKVKAAAGARLPRSYRLAERVRLAARGRAEPARKPLLRQPVLPPPPIASDLPGLVVIGASTGGPPALDVLLSALPADFPWPIVIAQHMPASFTAALAQRLDRLCALRVVEAARPTLLEPGLVVLAKGDADLLVTQRSSGLMALPAPTSALHRWHPSVDRLMQSASNVLPPAQLVGVLLTGMGDDGAATMAALRRAGGFTIAEAEESAVVWGMPGELVKADGASLVLPIDAIAERLVAALMPS